MRTTIHLPDDLHRRAKRKAAEQGRTLTELIEEGLRSVIDRPASAPRSRVMPRVSSVSGRVVSGIDLTRTSELLDQLDEDLPIVKRR